MPDPTTQSNYLSISTQHLSLDWTVDFDQKVISGSIIHDLLVKDEVVKEVVFDSGDLEIAFAKVNGENVSFKLGERHPVMGSSLHVPFSSPIPKGTKVNVKIVYKTSPDAVALQFLDKEQTQGKRFPYLFSQCQPIYARTMAPLQDTPSVKITYDAKVTSILPALMSAIRQTPPSEGPLHDGKVIGKDEPTPIPSYLIAIACGDVCFKPFPRESKDWTTGIWAEPNFIDAAFWEFSADTNRFLTAEEKIVGSYRFGVYDLLVLPPSFPYGGMENSCLTFLTPTLLTGDRTLVDVVVHELTHSWFGNGVTHQDATHFWLNEGWTTYIERVLQQAKYQRLVIDFDVGEDPDDAYSTVPYEKGANLILYLERLLGGLDIFLPYVKDYVTTFMGQSINTDIWRAHLYKYWSEHGGKSKIEVLDSVDWNAWFYGEGLTLPVEMKYDITLAEEAYALASRWDASRKEDIKSLDFEKTDLDTFDSNQKAVFLDRLDSYPPLPPSHLAYLGSLYSLSTTANAELRFRYYELALSDSSTAESKALATESARWVVGDDGSGIVKGRMKICRPVLRAANRADPEATKRIFISNKKAFHPIVRKLIEKDLGLV